jgi:predicted dehydrogenase
MRVIIQAEPSQGGYAGTTWRISPQYRGGFHLDGGVHHIAQMRLLCGDIQALQAYVQYANPKMGGPSDMVLNLHFVGDAIGSYAAAYLAMPTPGEPNEMRIYGTEGVLVSSGRTLRIYPNNGQAEEHTFKTDGGYYNQFVNFYDAITYDEPIVGTIEQSFANLLIVMQALDSAESRRVVDVTETPGGLSERPIDLWRPRGSGSLFEGLPIEHIRSSV